MTRSGSHTTPRMQIAADHATRERWRTVAGNVPLAKWVVEVVERECARKAGRVKK